ncbi:MAG TPA: tetratricopeptide repeat protein [Xanthobacteraceae bacterium]|jgi:predicted O-linked N-acetylglucosamine transferase (SPINDLY family)|nr:tetratricopeptide repeat protein [Xanthobacteraceae bacterium]
MKRKSHFHSTRGSNPVGHQALLRHNPPASSPETASAFQQAVMLHQAARLAEAEQIYRHILAAHPRHFESHFMLGVICAQRGSHADAIGQFDIALKINPKSSSAHNSRGIALGRLRRAAEALASFDRAVALKPDYAEAFSNRANALRELNRPDEALASCDRAIALKPDYAEALNNRANVLLRLKRYADAIADFARTLGINADFPYAKGMLSHAKMQLCDWRSFATEIEDVKADARAGMRASTPFALLGQSGAAGDQLLCSQVWVREKCPAAPTPIHKGEKYRHDKIRVAYLSADFGEHPTSYLLAGLFEEHDRARFDVFGMSLGLDGPSAMRSRIARAFDRFVDVSRKDDREVANLLRHLEVDIAVDLMGFTHESRPGIFAMRPAPVQVNYLGFPGTMGADYMDYIIADRFVIPAEHHAYYGEKVVYLPDVFQANDSKRSTGEHAPTRASVGLPEVGFAFCSFSNSYKITPTMFDIWMRLVRTVDGSVLWLLGGNAAVEGNLRREAEARGVAADRLIFAPRVGYSDYLRRYQLADLFLDTSPFNAGATASDALWAGLPLLTCAGEAFAARMAGSLLNAVGLPELVTASLDEYERTARRLAGDRAAIGALKEKLAQNRAACALFDTARFRRHIEAAYRTMWQRRQAGDAPASFAVEATN